MAFRHPESLRDFLVRARLKLNSDDDNQMVNVDPMAEKDVNAVK